MKQLEILDVFDAEEKIEVFSMLQSRFKSFLVLWVTDNDRSDYRPSHLLQKVKEKHGVFSNFAYSEVSMTEVETELRVIYQRSKRHSNMNSSQIFEF